MSKYSDIIQRGMSKFVIAGIIAGNPRSVQLIHTLSQITSLTVQEIRYRIDLMAEDELKRE